MGIEFPTGSDACDNYGYTFDSSCTADSGTLGYDQNFVYTELTDGTKAWIPLNGVLAGKIGSDGPQGRTGPPAALLGSQGFQGPTGEKGDPADIDGGQGETGNTGEAGTDFPARGGDGSPQTSFRYNIVLGDPYTAKRINSQVDLDYEGLENVSAQTDRFAQIYLQSGRNDLTTESAFRSVGQRLDDGTEGQIKRPSWQTLNSDIDEFGGSTFTDFQPNSPESTESTRVSINGNAAAVAINSILDSAEYHNFVLDHPTSVSLNSSDYDNDFTPQGKFNIMHPLRHINADDAHHFSLYRRDNLPANAWVSRYYRSFANGPSSYALSGTSLLSKYLGSFQELLQVSTTSSLKSGIDLKGITGITYTFDSPVMQRVIEFPYVDVFREFQGARPEIDSETAHPTRVDDVVGQATNRALPDPYGTLPMPGDPLSFNKVSDGPLGYLSETGAVSRIRDLNMQWAKEEADTGLPGGSVYGTTLGQFNHNPFNYAPLNLSTSEGTGPNAVSWKTVYGGRMPYMFYWGGPCIVADGNPEDSFDPTARWNSTKGSDNKHAIYIQEVFNKSSTTSSSFQSPEGSSGPWPLRQSMHFNGFKYTNNGASIIDKIVFLTGTAFGPGKEMALGTGGSVTLTFSQWNQDTDDGGPTYDFGNLFEFVAGTCADTDPKVSSSDSEKVRFYQGVSGHTFGRNIGDVDVFHIFCTGLVTGTAGYLITHQQYHT